MNSTLYVGNLRFETTEGDLRRLFGAHGAVRSAQIIMDRDAGRPKGFAFVEMVDEAGAKAAITALNGKEIEGRFMTVRLSSSKLGAPRSGGRAEPASRGRKHAPALGRRLRKPPPGRSEGTAKP